MTVMRLMTIIGDDDDYSVARINIWKSKMHIVLLSNVLIEQIDVINVLNRFSCLPF